MLSIAELQFDFLSEPNPIFKDWKYFTCSGCRKVKELRELKIVSNNKKWTCLDCKLPIESIADLWVAGGSQQDTMHVYAGQAYQASLDVQEVLRDFLTYLEPFFNREYLERMFREARHHT